MTKDIKTSKSVQEIQNLGFDTDFNLPVVENLIYNPVTDQMDRMVQPGKELPTQTLNGSLVITYNASDQPITIEKTISGTVYTKTLTWVGDVCTAVSSWS